MSDLRHSGVWTPWAAVLCYECHGARFNKGFGKVVEVPDPQFTEYCALQPQRRDEGPTVCDKCDRPIWVREDVAELNELGRRLDAGFSMEQTGGMCAGLSLTEEGGRYIFVTSMDGWCVGVYRDADQFMDGDYESIRTFEDDDVDPVEVYLRSLL